ncbi:MAG: hypothetical protein ACYDEQ_06155 [Desulfocucumaceae bacterium]
MKYVLLLIPVLVTYYTFTYGLWAWKKGNRAGGTGVFFLAALTLALSVYSIFIRTGF